MDALKYSVADNINLYVIDDKKYKTVYSAAFLHRRLDRDEVTLNSLLSKVLKTGTQLHPSMSELSKYAESLYGCAFDVSITKRANVQSIVSTVNMVSDRFTNETGEDDAFNLMLDLLFRPAINDGAFPADCVNSQKSNLKDDIDGLINDKRSYANVRCIEEMCKGEPNAIVEIGYAEDLDKIDGKVLYDHYESIIHSSPIDVFVVGDVNAQKLCDKLRKYFSAFSFDRKPVCVEFASADASEVKYVEDNLDVNQGKLVMGLRTGVNMEHPDYYALFGNFTIPLLDISKLDMKAFFLQHGYEDVMKATWFCHSPIDGKPCGKCNPCKGVVEEGMAERLDDEALVRYKKAKKVEKIKSTAAFKLAKKILRR